MGRVRFMGLCVLCFTGFFVKLGVVVEADITRPRLTISKPTFTFMRNHQSAVQGKGKSPNASACSARAPGR